jgi:hypothetical protein
VFKEYLASWQAPGEADQPAQPTSRFLTKASAKNRLSGASRNELKLKNVVNEAPDRTRFDGLRAVRFG